jgi:hypothetical protein
MDEEAVVMSDGSLGDAVSGLANTFTGQLLQAKDPGYGDARKVHNGLIDKRPALIARCRASPMSSMQSSSAGISASKSLCAAVVTMSRDAQPSTTDC